MAIQYSLSYDADGNPSLVKNTVQGQAPVIKTDFNIGAYEPTRTVSTDYNFTSSEDPFSEESQLKILKTYIAENDSDPTTFVDRDVRQRDRLSAMDKDKMSRISKFVGKEAAVNFEKYAKRSATAQELKGVTGTIGLFTSNPLNTILNIGARAVGNYSDKQIDKIMNNMYASDNFQNYMKELDYEYYSEPIYSNSPFASWTWNTSTGVYDSPVAKPDDKNFWHEGEQEWTTTSVLSEKPYASWILKDSVQQEYTDEEGNLKKIIVTDWAAPVEKPNDGNSYLWDEETLNWIEV